MKIKQQNQIKTFLIEEFGVDNGNTLFAKQEKILDEIIKNTYRTLLTRGQNGCYIYCEDKALSEYLKKRSNQNEGIVYPIDHEEQYSDLIVAEESEEYE